MKFFSLLFLIVAALVMLVTQLPMIAANPIDKVADAAAAVAPEECTQTMARHYLC